MAGTSVLFVGNQNMVTLNYTARQRIKKIVSFLFSQLLFNSLKNHSYSAKNGIDLEIIFLHFNGEYLLRLFAVLRNYHFCHCFYCLGEANACRTGMLYWPLNMVASVDSAF